MNSGSLYNENITNSVVALRIPSDPPIGPQNRNNDKLRVMNLNIAGISGKIDSLSLTLVENNVDIVSIVEHWCRREELNMINLKGYTLCAQFCRIKNRGGVCVFARTALNMTTICYKKCIERVFEACVAVLKNKNNKNCKERYNLYVVSVYRTPESCVKEFIKQLGVFLFDLYCNGDNFIICGDVNINFLQNSTSKTDLLNLLSEYDIYPHISQPTRVSRLSSTCIDNIFSNHSQCEVIGVKSVFYSDHMYQLCEFSSGSDMRGNTDELICRRNLSSVNLDNFYSTLCREQWQDVYAVSGFQGKFAAFYETFLYHYNCNFPYKVRKVREDSKRWYSPQLKDLHSLLCEMKPIERRLKCPIYTQKYNDLLKQYKNSVAKFKRQQNSNRLANAANLCKESWKIVNESRNGNNVGMPTSINGTMGDVITDPSEKCNKFNDFFLHISDICPLPKLDKSSHTNFGPSSIFLSCVTPDEVRDLLHKTTQKPAAGLDEIHGRALGRVRDIVCYPLAYLINESFISGQFPDSIKISKCIPVFKNKGSRSEMENYRSVCVQSQMSKIFEICYSVRLIEFLERNGILNKSQNGFRPGKSTNTAILDCLEFVYSALNGKEHSVGLFYDLSRAFDTINHKLLLDRLFASGVRGVALDWAASYLKGREQTVQINGTKSYKRENSLGVPQGSILGPLFFIIFVNNVADECCLSLGRTVLYADDTNILLSHLNLENLVSECNCVSQNFSNYCDSNGLILNSSKTLFMQFFPKNVSVDYDLLIRVNGKSIKSTNEIKFLGLIVDCKLTWEKHIDYVCGKISSLCFLIRRLRETVSEGILKLVYYGLVQSTLQYGLLFWGSSAHFQKAFIMQKKAIRNVAGISPLESCRNIFKSFKILTLPCLYVFQLINFIYTNGNSLQHNFDIHSHDTRAVDDFHLPYSRLGVGQNSPFYMGIKCFNKIKCIVNIKTSPHRFKKETQKYLCEKAFYSVQEFLDCSE